MTIFYTAPTAIRACMKWGAEEPAKHDLSLAAAAGERRRADQPEGVALVPRGDRRRALPDRRHVVADRDRRDHDLAAPGAHAHEAGFGNGAAAGDRREGRRRGRQRRRVGPGPARAHRAVAVDAAHALQGTTASSTRTSSGSGRTPTSSATPRSSTRTATCGSSAASTTSSTSPATGSPRPRSSQRSSPIRRSRSPP